MAATFVFVRGAFGSPSELAPAVPYLESRGHRVVNVDLPCERPEATLDDYASAVGRAMEDISGPRILVAHSAGGATTPLVAARIEVDRLVFAAAVVPVPGQSIYEAVGPATQTAIMSVSFDNGDGTRSFDFDVLASLAPPQQREAYLAFLRATQRKQGMRTMYQPWPGAGIPDIPRSYILCIEDKIIPGTPACLRCLAWRHPDRDLLGAFGIRHETAGTRWHLGFPRPIGMSSSSNSTDTPRTRVSIVAASNLDHRNSMEKSSVHIALTKRSSINSSPAELTRISTKSSLQSASPLSSWL